MVNNLTTLQYQVKSLSREVKPLNPEKNIKK